MCSLLYATYKQYIPSGRARAIVADQTERRRIENFILGKKCVW